MKRTSPAPPKQSQGHRLSIVRPGLLPLIYALLVSALLFSGCDFLRSVGDGTPKRAAGLELIAEGLNAPVALAEAPDQSGRLFIVDQAGQIWVQTPGGRLLDEPFLDISDRLVELNPGYDERGLLGLAFHPDFAENGRFFVFYSAPLRPAAPDSFNHTNRVSEFQVSASHPNVADPGSERVLMRFDQPYGNHNGGTLAFGPTDGYLYVTVGDGGNRDDEGIGHVEDWYEQNAGGNGQDTQQNLLGSILRIDVDGGSPYGIPSGNPFAGSDEGLDEIWAYGFRNPYRFSFDQGGSHRLFVGDAGQELWEEVSIAERGGNYGWNVKEGTHCFDAAQPEQVPAECPQTDPEGDPLIDPVIEFPNAKQPDGLGYVVVGGHVYRGEALPWLKGRYLFGVWSATQQQADGRIYVADQQSGPGLWSFEELDLTTSADGNLNRYLLSFGQDRSGELYVLTDETSGPSGTTGKVFKLVPPEQAE